MGTSQSLFCWCFCLMLVFPSRDLLFPLLPWLHINCLPHLDFNSHYPTSWLECFIGILNTYCPKLLIFPKYALASAPSISISAVRDTSYPGTWVGNLGIINSWLLAFSHPNNYHCLPVLPPPSQICPHFNYHYDIGPPLDFSQIIATKLLLGHPASSLVDL